MTTLFSQATTTVDTTPPPAGAETTTVPQTPPEVSADGSILDQFLDTFTSMGNAAVAKAPYILIGLAIFLIGFIFAKVVRATTQTITVKIGLDAAAEKLGLSELLGKIGIRKLSKFISSMLFYVLILFFIKLSSDFMGVSDLSKFIDSLITFLPRLLVAFLILMAGLLAADLVRKMIVRSLDRVGIEYSGLIGNFAYGLLAVMILTVVLSQIGIQTDLLNATVKIFLAAGSFAIALAMGFGLRPIARNVVAGVYARDIFPPGAVLEIKDQTATVVEVGPVSTRLETETGGYFVIPNYQMVNKLHKGSYADSKYIEKNHS